MLIQLNFYPSRHLLAFILLLHLGAMTLLLALPLPVKAMLLIEILLAANFIYSVRRYVVRNALDTIIKVCLDENKVWQLSRRDGKTLSAKLMGDSLCSNMLVILNFRLLGDTPRRTKYSVLVLPDSVDPVSYRRLRAWFNSQ